MKKSFVYEYKTEPYHIGRSFSLYPIPHLHKNVEIVYVISGNCVAYADHNTAHLQSGDMFISFPNQIHYYESSVGGEFYVLIFNADILFGLKDILFDNYPKNNVITLSDDDPLKALFLSTMENYGEYERTIKVGLINQAVAGVLPKFKLKPRIKTENASIQSILNFCEESYTNNALSLDIVSENLHLSKYHISHLLNEKLNISFNSYINKLRVNKACSLLDETEKKVIDISEEVGFGSLRSLNRSFLEIIGTTPLKYRSERKPKINSHTFGKIPERHL